MCLDFETPDSTFYITNSPLTPTQSLFYFLPFSEEKCLVHFYITSGLEKSLERWYHDMILLLLLVSTVNLTLFSWCFVFVSMGLFVLNIDLREKVVASTRRSLWDSSGL